MGQKREHSWTKDDTILTLYYVKYGLKNIPVNDEKELAEWIIGASKVSLDRQAANIRYLLGYDPTDNYVLDAYSAIQAEVVEEYGKMDRGQLQSIVDKIIMKADQDKNKQLIKAKALEKDKKVITKRHKEASQKHQKMPYVEWVKTLLNLKVLEEETNNYKSFKHFNFY